MAGQVPYADKVDLRQLDSSRVGGGWQAIAPSDTTDLDPRPKAIKVIGTGTVVLADADYDVMPCVATDDGDTIFPYSPTRILQSGTDALGNDYTTDFTVVFALF